MLLWLRPHQYTNTQTDFSRGTEDFTVYSLEGKCDKMRLLCGGVLI